MFKLLGVVFLISVSAVCSQQLGQVQKELLLRSVDECVRTSGVDMAILNRARENDYMEDRLLMDYYVCMFRADHLSFIDEAGGFLGENLRSFLHLEGDAELWNDVINNCFMPVLDNDIPMAVYRSVKCFTGKIGKLNIYSADF